ncbi:MAG TPA: hypothetical protein VFE62_01830 [Gemmataceae bacterium]|nr:hypothetical protein [Gemmataceae bacterium]
MQRAMGIVYVGIILFTGSSLSAQEKPVPYLAGWPGICPHPIMYIRNFERPIVSKETWQQTTRYDWRGGRAETIRVTLMKDAAEAKKYQFGDKNPAPKTLAKTKVGEHTAWQFESGKLVIDLGNDRLMILEAPTWKQHESNLPKFAKQFSLAACAKALEQPPRTDFRRRLELFRGLKKGMPIDLVREHVGDSMLDIGSVEHIFVYRLDDGTHIHLGFRDLKSLDYVKQIVEGVKVDLLK